MTPRLYITSLCPTGQSCLLTARAINLKLEVIKLNPSKGKHFSPEFLKINPEKTTPTLDDNGFVIRQCHAINIYLVQKYGKKDDFLYPQDLQTRILIDQSLHFDCEIFQPKINSILESIIKLGVKLVPKEKSDNLIQALTTLETTLRGKKYEAGNNVSVGDLSTITTVFACSILAPIASNRFPNVVDCITRMESLPYYK